MFKWFQNLTTGESDFFNEISSSDSYMEGGDSNGDFHHINKCGNMGIDTFTGNTYSKTGNFIHKSDSLDTFHSPFEDNDDPIVFLKKMIMEYINLRLSAKWTTCNLGASSPIEGGEFYAMGETSPKS